MEFETMTPQEKNKYLRHQKSQQKGKFLAGLLIVLGGTLYLLKELNFDISREIFSWPVYLIAIGLVVLTKHNFKSNTGWALVTIGAMYFLHKFFPNIIETRLIFPIIIIFFGFSMIFKSKKKSTYKDHYMDDEEPEVENFTNSDDYINSTTIFGGASKNVVSKNFKGANITSIFGGTEVNLLQADFENEASIEVTCMFGGVSLLLPVHWELQSEVVTIFGSLEDKREVIAINKENNKVLRINGNCTFGGIEIKSFK